MNILVTGGSGFIGVHLIEFLRGQYKFRILKGNLKDQINEDYRSDVVIHLAGRSKGGYNELFENNVNTTLNVLNFCKSHKSKIIFASTVGVYGEPKYLPIDENHPISPINDYSKTKLEAEKLCRDFSERYGVEAIILRLSNVYGIGQKESFLIQMALKSVKNNYDLTLTDPKMVRDYIYIDDACDAFLKSIKYKTNFEIFNISYNKGTSIEELIRTISVLSRKKINVKYSGYNENEIKVSIVSNKKAELELKWKPKISLEKGIDYLLTK